MHCALDDPGALAWAARQMTNLRYDIDGDRVDYLDDTRWLTVPTLVFHGDRRRTVRQHTGRPE